MVKPSYWDHPRVKSYMICAERYAKDALRKDKVFEGELRIPPRENIKYMPNPNRKPTGKELNWQPRPDELRTKCNEMAQWMINFYNKNKQFPEVHVVQRQFIKFKVGFNPIYECAYEKLENYVDEKEKAYRNSEGGRYKLDSDRNYDPHEWARYGSPDGKKPTPIDHFVNGLQEGWDNLSKGKTFFGGQPTIITGSVPWYVPRPLIIP